MGRKWFVLLCCFYCKSSLGYLGYVAKPETRYSECAAHKLREKACDESCSLHRNVCIFGSRGKYRYDGKTRIRNNYWHFVSPKFISCYLLKEQAIILIKYK